MCGACTTYPGAETLEELLYGELDEITVEYKQWVTDRAALMTVTHQSDELIENLVSKIPKLTHHHTAKQQVRYFYTVLEKKHPRYLLVIHPAYLESAELLPCRIHILLH
jgi:hypothetical protein